MGADSKDDREKTESLRLLLVHDAESRTRNLDPASALVDSDRESFLDSGEHRLVEDEVTRKALSLRDGLQASRFPAHTPVASTTDAHWTAQYQGQTVPARRFETPPAIAAILLDVTDPGGSEKVERHDTLTDTIDRRIPTLRIERAPERDVDTVPTVSILGRRILKVAIAAVLLFILTAVTKPLWLKPAPPAQKPSAETLAEATTPSTSSEAVPAPSASNDSVATDSAPSGLAPIVGTPEGPQHSSPSTHVDLKKRAPARSVAPTRAPAPASSAPPSTDILRERY